MRRRPHGGLHSTTASEAPCLHCRRPLLYAWDEGERVRVDAAALDGIVGASLRAFGLRVYALTAGRNLIFEPLERAGSLRSVVSRHVEHRCPKFAPSCSQDLEQLALFDVGPASPSAGMW